MYIPQPEPAIVHHTSRDRLKEKHLSFFHPDDSDTDLPSSWSKFTQRLPDRQQIREYRPSRRAKKIIILTSIVLVVVIILAASLGTSLHHKRSNNAPDAQITEVPSGGTPTPPSPSGKPRPTAEAHMHALAATGWIPPETPDRFMSWVFSQNADGKLSRHTFDSTTGNWTRVADFAVAKPRTPLAAMVFNTYWYNGLPNYDFKDSGYMVSLVYVDEKDYLNEWIFTAWGDPIGRAGSLTSQKYITHPNTTLAAYWPQITYQGVGGELRSLYYECHRKNDCWNDGVTAGSNAINGTQLALVPDLNNNQGGSLFFTEMGSERLLLYKEDNFGNAALWANEAFSPLTRTPSPIAAFATTRPYSPASLNTYLLFQNATGLTQISWSDNDYGWRGPTFHDAFAGAENNTAIACITGPTFGNNPMVTGDMLARCYFQAGRAVREVRFNSAGGSNGFGAWEVVGNVPTIEF